MSLYLPNVTAVIVDTHNTDRAVQTFNKVEKLGVEFHSRILFSNETNSKPFQFVGDIVDISSFQVNSKETYSKFIIKELWRYITTSHILIMQWDGYILNPEVWNKNWLQYDYIGARWNFHNDMYNVGNGGFSLRSIKLMEAAANDPKIVDYHPEDNVLCRWYRPYLEQNYHLKWAPPEVADLFSDENSGLTGTFGFHGGTR